jgi:hypothetical protein
MQAVLIASILIILLSFALLSIRLLFVKGGEFRGSCANNNPMLQKEGVVCGVCGRKTGEPCANNT